MSVIVPNPTPAPLRQSLEGIRPTMAKAVNKVERTGREQVGQAIARTFALAGVSQKEAAALLDRDVAQISRWCAGTERAAIDLMLSVPRFRGPFVMALAEIGGDGVDIVTEIRVRRIA